jgi:hypothetical protein
MTLSHAEIERVRSAIEGLLGALEALTEPDGTDQPPASSAMADLLRIPLARLERAVADMRWLLLALQRVEHRYAMSRPMAVE